MKPKTVSRPSHVDGRDTVAVGSLTQTQHDRPTIWHQRVWTCDCSYLGPDNFTRVCPQHGTTTGAMGTTAANGPADAVLGFHTSESLSAALTERDARR